MEIYELHGMHHEHDGVSFLRGRSKISQPYISKREKIRSERRILQGGREDQPLSLRQYRLRGGLQTNQEYNPIRSERRILQPSDELQMWQRYVSERRAAKDRRLLVIAELNKKGTVSFGVGEGNSGPVSFFAENLKPQEAVEAVKLLTELNKKGTVSFGVGEGNSGPVSFFAENLKPQEAVNLVKDIRQGNINLEELSQQQSREVEGGLTRIFESIGEVFTETAISVVSGILGGYMVTMFGPVGAIGLSLGLAAAEKKSQETSVGPGILGGALVSSFGPVGAIVIPLGAAAAVTKFKKI
jgi:hypothetical protein